MRMGRFNTHPSSKARNRVVEPESLDIKATVPTATSRSCSSFWAMIMGPIVLV